MSLGKRLITTGEAADIIGTDHFNTVLYTGNSSDQSITGVGFQPDLVWIKRRNTSEDHALFDSVRGTLNQISSNLTAAAYNTASPNEGVKSFDSDGFTTGDNGATNRSPNTYVSWNWKAGGSAVSNTDGSITSSVSANTDAGFSIVEYTANGTAGTTIGHGLSSAPELIIVKHRNGTSNWPVYATGLSAVSKYLYLNTSDQETSSSNPDEFHSTAPTSTVFSIGLSGNTNTNGGDYIAYCFHSVDGYQKIGNYQAVSGTLTVDVGFPIRFLMVKAIDNAGNWLMVDSARGGSSGQDRERLFANSNAAGGADTSVDFTGNTFTITSGSVGNQNTGSDYLYLAIA